MPTDNQLLYESSSGQRYWWVSFLNIYCKLNDGAGLATLHLTKVTNTTSGHGPHFLMLSASHIFLSSAVASLLKEPSIIGGPSIEKCRPIVSNLWQERTGECGMQPHIKHEERIRILLIFHGIYSRLTLKSRAGRC